MDRISETLYYLLNCEELPFHPWRFLFLIRKLHNAYFPSSFLLIPVLCLELGFFSYPVIFPHSLLPIIFSYPLSLPHMVYSLCSNVLHFTQQPYFALFLLPLVQSCYQIIQILTLPLLFQDMPPSHGLYKGIHLTLEMTEWHLSHLWWKFPNLKQVPYTVGTSSHLEILISIHPFWSCQIPSNSDILWLA